jgi:hypothetical protein
VLDQEGVGKLVEMGVKLGRQTRPDLEVGICGEHGGEPSSVEFCYRVGKRGQAALATVGQGSLSRFSHRAAGRGLRGRPTMGYDM